MAKITIGRILNWLTDSISVYIRDYGYYAFTDQSEITVTHNLDAFPRDIRVLHSDAHSYGGFGFGGFGEGEFGGYGEVVPEGALLEEDGYQTFYLDENSFLLVFSRPHSGVVVYR